MDKLWKKPQEQCWLFYMPRFIITSIIEIIAFILAFIVVNCIETLFDYLKDKGLFCFLFGHNLVIITVMILV